MKLICIVAFLSTIITVKAISPPDSTKRIVLPMPYLEVYYPLKAPLINATGFGCGARFSSLPGLMKKTGILPYSQAGVNFFRIGGQVTNSLTFQFGADTYTRRIGLHLEFGPSYFLKSAEPTFSNTTVFEYGGGICTGFRIKIGQMYRRYFIQLYVKEIGGQLMLNLDVSLFLWLSGSDDLIFW